MNEKQICNLNSVVMNVHNIHLSAKIIHVLLKLIENKKGEFWEKMDEPG